tara:strand:- start:1630 stop:1971 length:342 start_codon:yes stop_codon:yes gene_type:complete
MAAVYVSNLVINTGATFSQTFTLEDSGSNSALNLTGYTVRSQMRKHPAAPTFTDLNAAVLNVNDGTVTVGLTTSQTADLSPGRHVYNVLITDSSNTTTSVVEGSVLVRKGVTQ